MNSILIHLVIKVLVITCFSISNSLLLSVKTKIVISKLDCAACTQVGDSSPKNTEPHHIAFIVDGNGRWAESKNFSRKEGHRVGANITIDVVKKVFELQCIQYITLYLFSTENWSRPSNEIENIMYLLEKYLIEFSSYLKENKVQLVAIGQLYRLPSSLLRLVNDCGYKPSTNDNSLLSPSKTLVLAISYGGRDDIVNSCKLLVSQALKGEIDVEDVNSSLFASHTQTGLIGIPDPELIVRTSGEQRISNFFLWQSAYSEFISISKYWPDLKPEDIESTIAEFRSRRRRFEALNLMEPLLESGKRRRRLRSERHHVFR